METGFGDQGSTDCAARLLALMGSLLSPLHARNHLSQLLDFLGRQPKRPLRNPRDQPEHLSVVGPLRGDERLDASRRDAELAPGLEEALFYFPASSSRLKP